MARKGTPNPQRSKEEILPSTSGIKSFFRPTLLKITLSIFYVAICFMFLSDIFSTLSAIPCLVQYYPNDPLKLSLCTINPAGMKLNTIYLGHEYLDIIYQGSYLFLMILLLPYTLSCATMHYYIKYIRKF